MTKEDISKVLELALEYYKLEVFGTDKESENPSQERINWIYDRMNEKQDNLPKLSDNLKEAAREYARLDNEGVWKDGGKYKGFIAGAQWQAEQDQPITGNSLEQEWLRYVDKKKKEYGGELPSLGDYGWLQIARHFAEWQKEQMLKEAVNGEVVHDMQGVNRVKTFGEIPEWLHFGDKVRVIIVKEK